MSDILERLSETLKDRRKADPSESYVASLHVAGINKILEKVGEEAIETVIAAKDAAGATDKPEGNIGVIRETADLWFHTLVMLDHLDIPPAAILSELESRFGISGIAEKQSRKDT